MDALVQNKFIKPLLTNSAWMCIKHNQQFGNADRLTQYKLANIQRELNKCYCGFSANPEGSAMVPLPIATGYMPLYSTAISVSDNVHI
jgi:hypothetical protein